MASSPEAAPRGADSPRGRDFPSRSSSGTQRLSTGTKRELVVEQRDVDLAEELEQTEGAESVERPEHRASQPAAGRRRRIGDEEVKTEEDGDRNARVDEEVDAG